MIGSRFLAAFAVTAISFFSFSENSYSQEVDSKTTKYPTVNYKELYKLPDNVEVASIFLQFKEDVQVRLDKKKFNVKYTEVIDKKGVDSDVRAITKLLVSKKLTAKRTFSSFTEERLERIGKKTKAKKNLPNLNNVYTVDLPEGTTFKDIKALIKTLNNYPIVELAYAKQKLAPPVPHHVPSVTPDFQDEQDYLNAAPQGIDALYAWTQPGGTGEGVKVIDIEYETFRLHEDLPPMFTYEDIRIGTHDANHGTAVLGIIGAENDGKGITGIAHDAKIGFIAEKLTRADTILRAGELLDEGDVLLIEMQNWGTNGDVDHSCPCTYLCDNLIPSEFYQDNFLAISALTAQGIVVVATAGNGGHDLDSASFGGLFDRSIRDSGAIMVGARNSNNFSPRCYSNHGDRIDVNAWGQNVTTLSGGQLYVHENDDTTRYTNRFSGTSSAGAIVAGVVASLQGAVKARGLPPMTSEEIRELLHDTGTAQPTGQTQLIGRYPNLRTAIDSLPAQCASALEAPSNIALASSASSSFSITWDRVRAADEYVVMLLNTNSGGVIEDVATTDKLEYTFTGLTPGESYFAQVRSKSECGESGTNLFVFTTLGSVQCTSSPSAPLNINTLDATSNSMSVGWDEVSNSDYYTVMLDTNSDGVMDIFESTTSTSYTFNQLTPGSNYFAKVKAENACGESGTNLYTFTQLNQAVCPSAPAAPQNVSATNIGQTSFTVQWDEVDYADYYIVLFDSDGDGEYEEYASTPETSTVIEGLASGGSYFAMVKAINACGESGTHLFAFAQL